MAESNNRSRAEVAKDISSGGGGRVDYTVATHLTVDGDDVVVKKFKNVKREAEESEHAFIELGRSIDRIASGVMSKVKANGVNSKPTDFGNIKLHLAKLGEKAVKAISEDEDTFLSHVDKQAKTAKNGFRAYLEAIDDFKEDCAKKYAEIIEGDREARANMTNAIQGMSADERRAMLDRQRRFELGKIAAGADDASRKSPYTGFMLTEEEKDAQRSEQAKAAIAGAEEIGEQVGEAMAEGIAKGAGKGPSGPSGIEALGDEAGKKVVKAYNDAVEAASKKSNLGILYRENDILTPDAKERFSNRNQGLGETLLDTSKLDSFGNDMSNTFARVTDEIVGNARDASNRLSDIYSQIPESISRTSGGNIVNSVAMDAKAAYGEIQSLIEEYKKLPSALSATTEAKDLLKQAEKYKKEWTDAKAKRDAFVMNTASHNLKLYDAIQKDIEQQTQIRDAAQNVINHMKEKGVSEKDSEMVKYQKDVDAAVRKIRSLNKEQLKLASDRSAAQNKTTYETYTTKMYDAYKKLDDVMQEFSKQAGDDNLVNVTEIGERQAALYQEINSKMETLRNLTKEANTEQERLGKATGELNTKYRGLKPPKGMVKTDEFKNLEKQYRSAYKALQTLSDKQEKYLQNGTKVDSKAWKNLQLDIEQARQKLEEYDALLTKAQSEGEAFTTKKNFIDLRWSDVFGSGWGKAFGDALSAGMNSFKKTSSVTFGALKKMLLGIWSLVPKIGKGIKDWAKNQKSLGDSAKQMYKTFTGYLSMLRTRIRRKFISMVFEDLQNNIKALAKMSPRLNKVISDFIVSTKTLGAQIVAAFEPLVAKVLPYITMFVDYLTYAAQQMSQFISQLFGDDTWIKAVKGQYNFAESVDNSTSSTKKATKAAKEYENTVLSFDELHKLNGNDSGSEEDADGLTGVDLKYAELEANKLMEIARKIHKALSEGDFYGAGKAMGEGVNEAFAWLRDTAGWSKNAEKFTKWAENAGNLVNGIIDGINGIANGAAIGDVINSVVNIADILTNPDNEASIHFEEAGKKLGETFVSALVTIDWQTAGRALMNGIQGLAKGLTGFLNATVWEAVNKETGKTAAVEISESGLPMFAGTDEIVDKNKWELQQVKGSVALAHGLRSMFESAVDSFDSSVWSDLLSSLVNNFFEFIGELFSNPQKAAEFGREIGRTINETVEKIDAESVASGINNFVESLTSFVESSFDEVDWTSIFDKFKEIKDLVNWEPIGKVIGMALAPGLITGLVSEAGSLLGTLGEAWLVSQILGHSGAGAAGGAAAGGAASGGMSIISAIGVVGLAICAAVAGAAAGIMMSPLFEKGAEWFGESLTKLFYGNEDTKKFKAGYVMSGENDWFGSKHRLEKYYSALEEGWKPSFFAQAIAGMTAQYRWLFGKSYKPEDILGKSNTEQSASGYSANATELAVGSAINTAFGNVLGPKLDEVKSELANYSEYMSLLTDGDASIDDMYSAVTSMISNNEGKLPSAETEKFQQYLVDQIGEKFKDALSSSAGDIILMVNEGVLGRVAMNQQAKYTKQYLATSPKFSTT